MQEVEAVCNRVIIINKGEIVADGGIEEVKSGNMSGKQIVVAEFSENINPEKILEIEGILNCVNTDVGLEIESGTNIDIRPLIFQFAVKNNLTLLSLYEKQQNLENVFQQITRN